jgi:hypothetical protein
MTPSLLSEYISPDAAAKTLVLFGGSEVRRDEIVRQLSAIEGLTIYGTLSEAEGMAKILALPQVDIVLIGGRYTDAERERIRAWVASRLPAAQLTEPGVDYPYAHDEIFRRIQKLVHP